MTLATRISTSLSGTAATKLSGGDGAAALPPLVAPDAGTDSGVWVNAAQALSGGAATGGSGSYAYEWTRQSGGTVSIASGTTLTPTVTATSFHAATVMRLTVTDTVTLETAYDEVTLAATRTTLYGARRHWHFEPLVQAPTLNGSNVSQLNDIAPGGYHMTQSTASNQPLYTTSGGPNNAPFVSPNDANDRIANTAIALTAGRYLTRIAAVKSVAGTAAFKSICQARDADGVSAGDGVISIGRADSDKHMPVLKVSGGSQEAPQFTAPVHDANWNAWRITYRAAAVPLVTVAGTTGSPAASGTGAAAQIQTISWGHDSVSAGAMAFDICIEDLGTNELALEIAYMLATYDLVLT